MSVPFKNTKPVCISYCRVCRSGINQKKTAGGRFRWAGRPPGPSPVPCETGLDWWRQVIESCYRNRSDSGQDVDCDLRPDLGSPGLELEAVRAFLGRFKTRCADDRRDRPATMLPSSQPCGTSIRRSLPSVIVPPPYSECCCVLRCLHPISATPQTVGNAIFVNPAGFFRTYCRPFVAKDLHSGCSGPRSGLLGGYFGGRTRARVSSR